MKEDEEDTNEYEDLDQQASTSDTPGNVSGPGEDLSQLNPLKPGRTDVLTRIAGPQDHQLAGSS